MDSFRFDKEVQKHFAFLLEKGFALSQVRPWSIVYTRGMYEVVIDRDQRSFEIDIGIRSIDDKAFGTASFCFLVGAFDKAAGARMAASPVRITSPADAPAQIRDLANEFMRYVDSGAFDTPALWDKIKLLARARFDSKYPTISWDQLMERFDRCWETGNYSYIANVFTILRDKLSHDRQEKLEAAKEKLKSGGAH